jgi:tetratricopeptide (TPR) repeat protein
MSSLDIQNTIEELWYRAQTSYVEGHWSQAIEVYSQLLEIAPAFVPAYVQRGLIIHEMGHPEQAIHDFEHALHLDPQYGLAYYGRGWVKHSRGDWQGELEDGQRGLLLDPPNAGMYYRRIGAAQQGLKRYHDAITAYNQAITLNSENDEGTLYNRGLCYLEMKEYARALADFDHCLELDPDWAWAFAARGRVHLRMGNPDQAISDCRAAIQYQPEYAYSYFTRGLAYQEKGDTKRARADFETVLQLSKSPDLRQLATQQLKQLPKSWWPFG